MMHDVKKTINKHFTIQSGSLLLYIFSLVLCTVLIYYMPFTTALKNVYNLHRGMTIKSTLPPLMPQ